MMDINSPESNPLQLENCYFDATHEYVQGFKSLGMWTFHPTMKKILHLASMEIGSENTCNITQFFSFFNEIVAKEKKSLDRNSIQDVLFVMRGGYNYNAITQIYGEDFCNEHVNSCQWQFRNDVIKKSTQIPMEF